MNYQQALKLATIRQEEVVATVCNMCGPGGPGGGCGIYAFLKNGRFTCVAGMDESPVNKGALCAKGHAAPQWVYSADRLTTPLRRTGAKGEGKFEKISWDEAIASIAEELTRQKNLYGPESLAILAPAKRNYNDYLKRFLTVHGSPNYGHSGICAMQRAFCFMYTLGDYPRPDYDNAELIIYWGRQPIYAGPVARPARSFLAAKKRGAKIIGIKPSVEPDVGLSDIWVPVRPGTDAALALAMLCVVITEDLIDHEFVQNWCYGFNRLKQHIIQFTPEWAEQICGVGKTQIEEIARLYATTPKATIDLGNGVEHTPSSSDAIRAVAILMAVTGHLDKPGANIFLPKPSANAVDIALRDRYTEKMRDKVLGPEFPTVFQPFLEGLSAAYYRIFESVLTNKPYPIHAVIAPGTQPAVSTRGTKNVIKALEKLDFFVVADVARTAEMNYADIVIPLATGYETDHPFQLVPGWLMATRRVIEPVGSCKSIIEFILDLGVAMGYGHDFWNGRVDAVMDEQLSPFGLDMKRLRGKTNGITLTPPEQLYEKYDSAFHNLSPRLDNAPYLPQGKVALYNTSFEEHGFAPLPGWHEPPESISGTPELSQKYPFILSDYHTSKNFSASWLRNVPNLREIEPEPLLHIHPDAAKRCKVEAGDWVRVESPHGWIKVKAEIYPGIRPDTVMILHGWWQGCRELGIGDYPLGDGGANVNNMYSVAPESYDPLVTAMASQTLVNIRRWEGE